MLSPDLCHWMVLLPASQDAPHSGKVFSASDPPKSATVWTRVLVHSLWDFWHSIKKPRSWGAGTRTGVVKYGERIVSSGINTTGVGGFAKGRGNLSFLMLLLLLLSRFSRVRLCATP